MSKDVLKDFEKVTENMSVPVMLALLGRIHFRLSETDELEDVAGHVGEALSLLFDKHEDEFSTQPGSGMPQ
jgi:hypothetical protein